MQLILWRHAEAEDGVPDLQRRLTARGREQAAAMARWLRPRLPAGTLVLSSPAQRTLETADALTPDFRIDPRLRPDADVAHYLQVCQWPRGRDDAPGAVVLVGHQPILGELAWRLLANAAGADAVDGGLSVRKGAIWWLQSRERAGGETVLRAVLAPEMLDA